LRESGSMNRMLTWLCFCIEMMMQMWKMWSCRLPSIEMVVWGWLISSLEVIGCVFMAWTRPDREWYNMGYIL
jgi:hypothetical protein